MGKIGNILIAFVFLLSTVGVTVDKHYCMSILRSTNLFTSFDEKDCCGELEREVDGCCHNETEYVSVEDDFAGVFFKFDFLKFDISDVLEVPAFDFIVLERPHSEFLELDLPPPRPFRLHLLYGVFLN